MDDDEQTLEEQAFKELDQVFHQVLDELSNDPSLEKFRLEYEKLYRTLKISHENEKKLLKRCKELNDDIVSNTAKVQTALKLTQEDSQTITFLKTELEKTYKLLELTKEREQKSKEKITALDTEIKNLNNLIEQGNELSSGQSNRVHELLIVKDDLLKEKEMLNAIIQNVRHEYELNDEKLKNLDDDKQKILRNIETTQKEIQEKEEITQKYEEKKRKLQDELEQIKKNFDQAHLDRELLVGEKSELVKENDQINQQLRKLNQTLEAMEKNKKQMSKEANDSHWHVEEQQKNNIALEQQQQKTKETLAELVIELQEAKKKQQILEGHLAKLDIELNQIKEEKNEAERVKELTKQGVNELEKATGAINKQTIEAHSIIDELKRTRDILLKEVNRVDNYNRKQEEELNMKVKLEKEKENEVMGHNQELERKRKNIAQLEKEKEKYGIQAAQANAKYFHSLEEIKLKDNLISEFQKKNIETEAKLKQQQNLYETVRSDRNYESKRVTERQEELVELKRKYKISNHLISQLKEEIESKEKALTTEHLESKKKDKTMEEFKRQEDKYVTDAKQKDDKILEFKKGIAKLHFIIKESEQQKQKLKEEYDLVVAERDILGTQLIRRNEEAHLLHEKIKINQSYLSKGEAQYRDRLIDIEKLKQRIADLLADISSYNTNAAQVEDLHNEMHNLGKELTEEKLKVKSLSEEIENPINVHRWRKLEATDSETYELMTKIHTLQKRLIAKTEEVEQKEQLIQAKEKNIKELRDIMKRQPGIEEANMIQVYQQSLNQKLEQMKAMAKEMNMYQAEITQYKFEVDRLYSDLGDVKKKFYQQKKREQFEQDKESSKPLTIQINMPEKRIAGGGFNLVI